MRSRVALEPHVDIFPVDGPGFLTIDVDDPGWDAGFPVERFEGIVFLRLRVPADFVLAGKIEDLFPANMDIQVITRSRPQVVLEQAEMRYEDASIRQTVESMTKEANSKDHAALEALVQRTLTEVAL